MPRPAGTNAARQAPCLLAAALLALALGACRGFPPGAPGASRSAHTEQSAGPAAPPVVPASAYRTPQTLDARHAYRHDDVAAPVAPSSGTLNPVSVATQAAVYDAPSPALPRSGHASPSPALPRAAAMPAASPAAAQVSHATPAGDAEFTPNIARVGHVPMTLPPAAFTGNSPGHCWNDPCYPPSVWHLRREEFLCDGGDNDLQVRVNPDWSVRGLDQEDTVVHFDTLDGATEIEASNKVCIYAPRFAAVRKTVGVSLARSREKSAGVATPEGLVQQENVGVATTVNQPLQPGRNVGINPVVVLEDRNLGVELEGQRLAAGLENGFLLYENLQIIRRGQFDQSEKARLAESIDAAAVWTENQAVQVIVDGKQAVVQEGVLGTQEIDRYERMGKPRMRIIKVASRKDALPGEIVNFTLRFDNIGDQEVGNVTIIDNLTTRLEYVPDSAECSLKANFVATENEGDSLVLRWEIIEPLDKGQGGIIRFKCRVR